MKAFAMTPHPVPCQTARALTDGHTILAALELAGTPERVFQALTTNEAERWWGSAETYRITDWKADLRVGGRWTLNVRLPDGTICPASGEYLEIEAPRKIVQTRRYEWDFPELGRRDTTVVYRLDRMPSGTRLTVRHDGFCGLKASADQHVLGWERFLGFLADYLNTEVKV
jgi:uncharacterized protein YndB with AHSA1/START domain